jgi:hypothetical protein
MISSLKLALFIVLVTTAAIPSTAQNCENINLPKVGFVGVDYKIDSVKKVLLSDVANKIHSKPTCNVVVVGYGGSSNKRIQQLSWERVNAVIKYLTEKEAIREGRFIFKYGQSGGNANRVTISFTDKEAVPIVPAPHPHLRKRN